MGRELDHQEASELLGAYALDAVDADEREPIEAHVAGCGRCQAELVEHREVAALLTGGPEGAPADVWSRIAGSLEEPPPPFDLETVVGPKSRHSHRSRRDALAGRRLTVLVAAFSVVAVLAVGGLVASGAFDRGGPSQPILQAHPEQLRQAIAAAAADPESTRVTMRSDDGALFADSLVLPDGQGYLVSHNLPALDSDRTYQLWALDGFERVSIGILGPGPGPSAFRATGPVTALAITEEKRGGVASSDKAPVVLGTLRTS